MGTQYIPQTYLEPYHSKIVDLPWVYRLTKIETTLMPNGGFQCNGELFHEKATIGVTWLCDKDCEIPHRHSIVTPEWASSTISLDGMVIIKGLKLLRDISQVNLFDTVPYEWIKDRNLVTAAKQLVSTLPVYFVELFNGIFWEYRRFHRLVVGPSSLNGHHNSKHGNLKHMIEVTNNALLLAKDREMVNLDVLIIASLLHDAGKADEYQFNHTRNMFEISPRGALIGHKLSVVEWIAAAIARYNIAIPENQYLSLMHALTATKGAPNWVGIREPVSPEANLLSVADRLSGSDDLFRQTASNNDGFGDYHKHMKGRPFLVA